MPTLPIVYNNDYFLDGAGIIIWATMLFPKSQKGRDSYYSKYINDVITADEKAIINLHKDEERKNKALWKITLRVIKPGQKPDMEAVHSIYSSMVMDVISDTFNEHKNIQGTNELKAKPVLDSEMIRRLGDGLLTGRLLFRIIYLDTFRLDPSVNKACFIEQQIFKRYLKRYPREEIKKRIGHSSTNFNYLMKAWGRNKNVAHLWAANWFHIFNQEPTSEGYLPGLGGPPSWVVDPDDFNHFIDVAKWFEIKATTIKTIKKKEGKKKVPVINPNQVWSLPTDPPDFDLTPKRIPEIDEIVSKYETQQ